MIYLVGSSKGGAGKSTVAVNLAALLASQLERDVLLVDTDKKQPSSTLWNRLRGGADVAQLSSMIIEAADIVREVKRQARKYDDVVIDAGGHDSAELRAALLVADVVLMPAAPALFDVAALTTDCALLNVAHNFNPHLKAFLVINNASTNHQETGTRDMREQLPNLVPNYVVLDSVLRRRAAYDACKQSGLGVVEVSNAANASSATEMRNVFNELIKRVSGAEMTAVFNVLLKGTNP
jgi:chromosome partitioning protein